MIPRTPALLVGAANAVGVEGADLVHRVGFWSHFDQRAGRSSWPLPGCAHGWTLADLAKRAGVLVESPMDGDVFLIWSDGEGRFVASGVVVSVLARRPELKCTVVDEQGRRMHTFTSADRFVRWVDL